MLLSQYETWCCRHNVLSEELGVDELEELTGSKVVVVAQTGASSVFGNRPPVKITVGAVLSHSLPPLLRYWDSMFCNKTGNIPLLIMNKRWLSINANAVRSKNTKVSCTAELLVYNGTKVPSEWRMSFLDWTTAMRLWVRYWREAYPSEEGEGLIIAERVEKHIKNVLEVKEANEEAWPPAFCYCISQRQNIVENKQC